MCALLAAEGNTVSRPINFGGTDHWLYAYGTADGNNTGESWYLPALNLRPTLGTLHHNPMLVYEQMQALRASGQTAYVLPIWNKDLLSCEQSTCNDLVDDGLWGNVVDHGYAAMRPQHRANLEQIVSWAVELGFERIVVRFFYNGEPERWKTWDEKAYQKAWNFIVDAHDAATTGFNSAWGKRALPSYPVLMFDLGGEQAGIDAGQIGPFVQRLWSDYVYTFGVEDTLGFSFAWAPGRFATQHTWLAATGVLPKYWAFDIYGGMQSALAEIHAEMGPLRNQPIHILETFFNDAGTAAAVGAAIDAMPLMHVDSLVQWPLYSGVPDGHFSHGAVDSLVTQSTFTNYAGLMAQRKVFLTSNNADVVALSDVSCGSQTSLPCSTQLYWGTPPAGKKVGVYLKTSNGPSLVSCGGVAGSQPLTWIWPDYEYQLDAYYITGACSHPNPNPGAVLVGTAALHL